MAAEEAILCYLGSHDEIVDSREFAEQRSLDSNEVVNVIKSLHGFRYIEAQDKERVMGAHRRGQNLCCYWFNRSTTVFGYTCWGGSPERNCRASYTIQSSK